MKEMNISGASNTINKKVVLYNPQSPFFDMPLALLSIGTNLEQHGYTVVIVDARMEDQPMEKLLYHAKDAFIIGMSVLTGAPLKDAITAAKACKQKYSDLPIVWGGWHPSLFPSQIIEEVPWVDISVQGQGEWTFLEIANCLINHQKLDEIRGICYRKGQQIIIKQSRPLENINQLPRINYDLIDVEKYFLKKGRRQFDYVASIGCKGRCVFCADPFVFNHQRSNYTSERMIAELIYYQGKFNFTEINFQDESFFDSRKRTIAFAEGLIKNGSPFSWTAAMRADQDDKLSLDDFILLKNSGAKRFLIGVESGSQKMLDAFEKDITIKQIFSCADKCKKAPIHACFPFIIGFPGETKTDILETAEMMKNLGAKSPIFEIKVFFFKPYPGSKIFNDLYAGHSPINYDVDYWANFDFNTFENSGISKKTYTHFTRLEFYIKLTNKKSSLLIFPFKLFAQLRCKLGFLKLPLEMMFYKWIKSSN